jgi:hypothetical protein
MRQFLFIALSIAALTILAFGQDEAEYRTLMKSVPPLVGAIRNAPDNDSADANKLADTFDKMAAFWKAKNAPDATGFAETARDSAKAIADGTDKAGNLQKIQAQCGACHRAHREGAAPDFKIK